ncbi:A-adding tRNA nucleotidyltransferase [Thermoflexales bacterium]|nr:A-adding tRNA nucleotidyltransferase [Thermoflexales bacterium]
MRTDKELRRVVTDADAQNISRVEELSYELKVADVMARNVQTVTPDMQMIEVLELFRRTRISGAPVISNGKMIGIVSMEDLVRAMERGNTHARVRSYMTADVTTMHSYDSVVTALETFARTGVGRFPVVDETDQLVGILTKGDITSGTLKALQEDYQEEEVRRYRASHLFEDIVSDRTSLILRYHIKPRDYVHGGQASSYIKRALLRLGANAQLARRCGIAIYEAEMNLIIHTTLGGVIWVEIESNQISMATIDDGPGIADVTLARKAGWSTATADVREMGFGAGMGLKNIERCVDEMTIESKVGEGTRLDMKILLLPEESFRETS